MSSVKVFFISAGLVFSVIGIVAVTKKSPTASVSNSATGIEAPVPVVETAFPVPEDTLPVIDRISRLFTTGPSKLPIVETVEYNTSVPWLKGRPAWLSDYAAYYGTSRHFIARSLRGAPDYFSQQVSQGDRFNVFRKEKNIEFHLSVDLRRLQMTLHYVDLDTHERVLLKVYSVGVGRIDPSKPSGTATPVGTYKLGDRVAVYKPGVAGLFRDKKIDMIQVFGTRWIPFGEEIEGCSEPGKGYGLHGCPWKCDPEGKPVEDPSSLGKYESDGSIRLLAKDLEELYAVVITKPTFIHIKKDFSDIILPGVEVAAPSR